MAVIVRFEQSHKYSFSSPVKAAFRVAVVPAGLEQAKGLHYIILVDTSGSMKNDGKIDAAKEAAKRMVSSLPEGNYVTLIAFGTRFYPFYEVLAEHWEVGGRRDELLRIIDSLIPVDGTPLYNALKTALEIARRSGEPGYVILLTDGRPTDVVDAEKYRKLQWPERYKGVFIGIGRDYNAEVLSVLADISGGVFVHISEAEIEKLIGVFEETAASKVAARNLEIAVEPVAGKVRLIGYEGLHAFFPVVSEEAVEVIGEVEVPANYDGTVATVTVSYEEPGGEKRSHVFEYKVRPAASREEFLSGINREVYNTYLYAVYMEEARRLALQGRLDEATKRLEKAAEAAAKTMRPDLIEATKRVVEEVEATKRISPEEATRRLASEATRRLRG